MGSEKHVIGLFGDEAQAASAIAAMGGRPWKLEQVHGPFPSERISKALKEKKSRVGYFTLAGGIAGLLSGIGLAIYTATRWNLIIGGKPVVALIPFLIVGFEFTILFAVFGNVFGLLVQTGLPEFRSLETYDPGCSGESFGILASCTEGEAAALIAFFEEMGGTGKILDGPSKS